MTNALKFDLTKVTPIPDPSTDSGENSAFSPIGPAAEEARQIAQPYSFNLPHFSQPYDWQAIDTMIKTIGGVILDGFLKSTEVETLNEEIDHYLETNHNAGNPESGSARYDLFLGHKTIRLHGLINKVPVTRDLIGKPSLVEWATRMLEGKASSVLLNAAELIQIQPGEPPQFAHRDTDSWPLPIEADPVIVNAIVALDDFTSENGATKVAPHSWNWKPERQPTADEYTQAVMNKGDALLFRADIIHGGGENKSNSRRRALSISYCAGWLRPVENSFLNLSMETVRELPQQLQSILGYSAYDDSDKNGGMLGLYENGDPGKALEQNR